MEADTNNEMTIDGDRGDRVRRHQLPFEPARGAMQTLMDDLGRGAVAPPGTRDERGQSIISSDALAAVGEGKMFGVLTGVSGRGRTTTLRAFSGQLGGAWVIPGWCGPLFDVTEWRALEGEFEPPIKELTNLIERRRAAGAASGELSALKSRRAGLSRALMQRYQALYRVPSFHGQPRTLPALFGDTAPPPSGAGDCCAPKLLAAAIADGVRPTGMVEFYWGGANKTRTRAHGRIYPPCVEKCGPLLGFMLSGEPERTA